jgi:putative phosphoesterase
VRLGIISDVHANIAALEAVLDVFKLERVDSILCLGDFVGYGPFPNEVVARVKEIGAPSTLGAADERVAFGFAEHHVGGRAGRDGVADTTLAWTRQVIEPGSLEFLRGLPVQRRINTPAGKLRFFHGSPEDPAERIDLSGGHSELAQLLERHRARLIACGGSHIPYLRKLPGGWLVNPGSVGLSLNGEPGADYALVELSEDDVRVRLGKAKYDFAAVAFDIIAWGLPEVIAEAVRRGRLPEKR